MIRTTAVPVRAGFAAASVLGIIALAGCGAASESAQTVPAPSSEATSESVETPAAETDGNASGAYADGTYTAEGAYSTPESVETISVTITLDDDVITSVEVTGDPSKRESEQYQGQFIGGISDAVVGQNIDEISVSRVAGSSLTSGGFNEAIEQIKAEAAA